MHAVEPDPFRLDGKAQICPPRAPAGFLTRQWYPPEAAEALRRDLAAAVWLEIKQASRGMARFGLA